MDATTSDIGLPSRRRSWTSEQKAGHVAAWQASGLSRSAYCRQHGLGYASFGRWVMDASHPPGPRLARVEVAGEVESIELVAPNGWRVRVSMSLGEVLREVGSCWG